MRGATPLIAAAALLAACDRAPAPDAPSSRPLPPVATATLAPLSLAGEWRVAGIDGQPFDEAYGLALSANARKIWWEPVCARFVRGYRIEGSRIVLGPDPDVAPRKPGAPTLPVCAIGPPERLAEVMRALDSAATIRRTPSNGIELAGGGHSLLLFSQ